MKKRVPRFWWDFVTDTSAIIVESDIEDRPLIAEYIIYNDNAMPQIALAEQLINDLNAGRISLKNLPRLTRVVR